MPKGNRQEICSLVPWHVRKLLPLRSGGGGRRQWQHRSKPLARIEIIDEFSYGPTAKVNHILLLPTIYVSVTWFEWILHARIEITRRDKWTSICYRSTSTSCADFFGLCRWKHRLSTWKPFHCSEKYSQLELCPFFIPKSLFTSNFTLWLGNFDPCSSTCFIN